MSTLIIKTNVSHGTDVLIKDMGIIIPASGGSETFTDLDNITNARESTNLRTLCIDDAYGAGSSTLILNNGTSDIPQADIDYWLAVLSGLLGPTGTQGSTGTAGLGTTGMQGVTGTADVLRGSIPFPTPPKDREFYWYEDEQTLFMYEGVTAMAWVDISSGSKLGVTGAQGYTGAAAVRFEIHSAFVSTDGNDSTAELENPGKPYLTIQAALDDIEIQVPSGVDRWIVYLDQGRYVENVVMLDWVVIRGPAGTNAIIEGTVTFDNAISNQSELELIGIEQTNAPCVICNAGADEAYIGLRTCWLTSTYDNDAFVKCTFEITRGDAYIYGSTEVDLYVTSNNVGVKYDTVFYIHGTEVAWLENITTVSYCVSADATNTTGFVTSYNTNPGTKSTWFQGYGFMELEDAASANIAGVAGQLSGAGFVDFRDFTVFNNFGASNTITYLLANSSGNIDPNTVTRFFNCDILFEATSPSALYMARAATPNDTIRVWGTYIQTDTDSAPERYDVSGYSGIVDYDITNSFGTTIQSGRSDVAKHGFFGQYIRVGGMSDTYTPTGGEIRYYNGDIDGYVDGQWKSLTQGTSTGIEGQTGAQGQTGLQGSTGVQGYTGSQGSTGAQGLTGSQGQTGVQGTTGVLGTTGTPGVTGAQGQTGIKGDTGGQGVTGVGSGLTGGTVSGEVLHWHVLPGETAGVWVGVDTLRVKYNSAGYHTVCVTGLLEVNGDVIINSDGSSLSDPRRFGFTGFSTGEAARLEFGDPWNALQNASGYSMQLSAYHTIILSGFRSTDSTGLPLDFAVRDVENTLIDNERPNRSGAVVLGVRGTTGQTGHYMHFLKDDDTVLGVLTKDLSLLLPANVKVGNIPGGYSPTGGDIRFDGTNFEGYDGNTWLNLNVTGAAGVAGATGSQGTTGSQGITGLQGTTGVNGTTGLQGTTGSQGTTGVQGQTGVQGVTGLRGTTGIQGTTGSQGTTGVQGTTGSQGTTGLSGYRSFHIFADQMDVPSTGDWPITGIAPASADTLNSALIVRRFDDTVQEGAGFILEIPDSTTNMVLDMRSRAQTTPTTNLRSVTPKLYARTVASSSAVVGWTGAQLSAVTFPTGTNYFSYDSRTVTLSSLNLTAGRVAQFELTRDPTGASGMPGDWSVLEVKATFT